jgi:hypothetical protein
VLLLVEVGFWLGMPQIICAEANAHLGRVYLPELSQRRQAFGTRQSARVLLRAQTNASIAHAEFMKWV